MPATTQTETNTTSTEAVIELIEDTLEPRQPQIEDITAPLVKAGQKRRERARKLEAKRKARLRAVISPVIIQTPPQTSPRPTTPQIAPYAPTGGLRGSTGYAIAGGNCINQVPYGLRGQGNPISWPVLTQTPYIGAAALWHYNHTGRVVGIWSNGDLEIAHENWSGSAQTRFPRSAFRGFR